MNIWQKIKQFLSAPRENLVKKEVIFPSLLFLICLVVLTLNRVPDTYLSGWDTLHPEFNFSLNFYRLIFGMWREEQGVGAVAAHAHMADIPRVILLWFSSIFFSAILSPFFIYCFLPYSRGFRDLFFY